VKTKTFGERCKDLFNKLRQEERQDPSRVAIAADHVQGEDVGTKFTPGEHYFQVRVNEMYLTFSRKWWVEYDPMVFVVSEFTYDDNFQDVPFVVGPAMLDKYKQSLPGHMVFENTRVAGLHPWRGGRLNLSVILYAVKRGDEARDLFRVVEGAAQVVDFGTALSTYLKVAGVVLDGVEAVLGLKDSDPIVGLRCEFDQDAKKDGFKPGYFALISPGFTVDPNQLWVRDRHLFYGAQPFRAADYVLYSITQTDERSDIDLLPFHPLWKRVEREAMGRTDQHWESAQANWSSLYQDIWFSPDLTKKQAKALTKEWEGDLNSHHETRESERGDADEVEPPELEAIRSGSLAIFRKS